MVQDISCVELASRLDGNAPIALLDVREDWELEICAINAALHIPLSELAARVDELVLEAPVAIICHHGVRSRHAGRFLEDRGFKEVFNVRGGIDAWALEIERDMSRYD
jgi:rhodanese-related sulfurtransferase